MEAVLKGAAEGREKHPSGAESNVGSRKWQGPAKASAGGAAGVVHPETLKEISEEAAGIAATIPFRAGVGGGASGCGRAY